MGIREWERVFGNIDSLASSGVESRVLISGRPVSMKKIRRARRYHQAKNGPGKHSRVESGSLDQTTSNNNPSDVVIEIQDSNGQWSQYTTPVDKNANLSQHQPTSGTREQDSSILSPRFQSSTSSLVSNNSITAGAYEGSAQPMDFSFVGYEAQASHQVLGYELYADITFPGSDLMVPPENPTDLLQFPPATSHLENLPFEQFERDLILERLQLATCPSPMQESGLLCGIQKLAFTFATEAATVMTQANRKSYRENLRSAVRQLQTLHSILPGVRRGTTPPPINEVEFHRLLLYSCANGFVGLDGIPFEIFFRFFNRGSNATSLLSRLFQDNPSHIVRSLAENLFRAAIESGDHNTTRFFLSTGLVSVDDTIFIVDGEKYTPLERAAELQRLKVIKTLLQFDPDVNKTFFNKYYHLGIPIEGSLGRLILGICPKNRTKRNHKLFSPEYLEVVDLLIQAGAKIYGSSIHNALLRFARMDLAKKLLRRLVPSDHSAAFFTASLEDGANNMDWIVRELTDQETAEIITKILSDCEQVGCKQCLTQFSDEISRAISFSAKRGHIKVVRSSFQHAKSLAQILSGAIRSGNRTLIEFVFAQNPNVSQDFPADIDTYFQRGSRRSKHTTPLAEAIDARDIALIKRLEDEGALENLDFILSKTRISRFVCAITAAIRVGDIEYVKKLLLHHPEALVHELEEALYCALKYRRESVVRLLFDLGAGESEFSLIEAYKWGNKSVLAELMSNPSVIFSLEFTESLKLDDADMGMFNFFHQSGRLTRNTLSRCISIAIRWDDREMLNDLLGSGADAMDEQALGDAVNGHNDMLRMLLEHIPPTKMPIRSFGTEAVKATILQDPSNIEALELLLDCTAVDFRSTKYAHDFSPLGLAIKKDALRGYPDFPLTIKLLDMGCDVEQIVSFGRIQGVQVNKTPILIAIQTKNSSMVQFLLNRGADINKEATYGIKRTPLGAAAEQGSLDLVELLLQRGAKANDKPAERWGATALQCAAMSGNCNIAALLLDNGALLYDPPSAYNGRTPIQGAAEYGRVDMIQFLWNASHGLGFPAEDCRKAMELAKENGHMACKDLILKLAVMSGNIPMIEMGAC